MGPGGFVMLIVGACSVAFTWIGWLRWKEGETKLGRFVMVLGVAFFAITLWTAPPVSWDAYEVEGVVAERYGDAVKMEDGRVIEMRDSDVIRVNEGDRVVLKCSKGVWGTGEFCGVK